MTATIRTGTSLLQLHLAVGGTQKTIVSRKDENDDDGSKGLKYKNIPLFYLFIFFLFVEFLMIGNVLCCVVFFRRSPVEHTSSSLLVRSYRCCIHYYTT